MLLARTSFHELAKSDFAFIPENSFFAPKHQGLHDVGGSTSQTDWRKRFVRFASLEPGGNCLNSGAFDDR
jgi:hypothetical protein